MIIYPVVAGKFYPADPDELRALITNFFEQSKKSTELPLPKAIIAPHAGYIYSGPIAAAAYCCLKLTRKIIKRVVILAPAHQYPVQKIATTKAGFYMTPLGQVKIDQEFLDTILTSTCVSVIQDAFSYEHALEVQLPFLQMILDDFTIVPFLVGMATDEEIASLLETVWDGPETLIVVSSDLSHYHPDKIAKSMDAHTRDAIIKLEPSKIKPENACGYLSIKGLLKVAKKKGLKATCLDLRNSGDTAGGKDSVVGYGAFHFYEKTTII